MIIKDIHGGTLSLTKTQLIERKGGVGKYYLNLADLKKGERITVTQVNDKDFDKTLIPSLGAYHGDATADFCPAPRRIGCRKFSVATYNKIMEAAEQARKTVKRAERKSGKSK